LLKKFWEKNLISNFKMKIVAGLFVVCIFGAANLGSAEEPSDENGIQFNKLLDEVSGKHKRIRTELSFAICFNFGLPEFLGRKKCGKSSYSGGPKSSTG
jgi:hypothetical protein